MLEMAKNYNNLERKERSMIILFRPKTDSTDSTHPQNHDLVH